MYLGTPLQSVYGTFDTGSELVWLQCEGNPTGRSFPDFNQSESHTYMSIPCSDKDMCDPGTSVGIYCGTSSCAFETDYADNTHVDGVMGGGNGKYSFPMQIRRYDPKFSYCVSSDMTKTYQIKFGEAATLSGDSTKVLQNKNTPFYYLDVLGIKVNTKNINVPPYVFEMSLDGSRGFIIDSGATLSYLTAKVFDAVKDELEQLLGASNKY
ncbi:aspartyl protease family protein 2-like [Silene latifolia]|uniref:aspartyl protease family protein 2-like n=1 Tax=Silene latifolia TaxID=37657 RepID=UPI003D76AF5F